MSNRLIRILLNFYQTQRGNWKFSFAIWRHFKEPFWFFEIVLGDIIATAEIDNAIEAFVTLQQQQRRKNEANVSLMMQIISYVHKVLASSW